MLILICLAGASFIVGWVVHLVRNNSMLLHAVYETGANAETRHWAAKRIFRNA